MIKLGIILITNWYYLQPAQAQPRSPLAPVIQSSEEDPEEAEEAEEPPEDPRIRRLSPSINPLSRPGEELQLLIQTRINDDLWRSLRGRLPCADSTAACVLQLQERAIANNPTLKTLTASIEEIKEKVETARSANQTSVNLSIFRPLVQRYLTVTTTQEPGQPPQRRGIIQNILGIFTDPIGSLNEILGIVGIPLLEGITGTNQQAQRNSILIGDLQSKVAQLEQARAELALTIRDKVTLATLDFEQSAREFQISQEVAERSQQQHEIFKLSYRFGNASTQQYLAQQNSLDRVRLSVYREWAKVQRQLQLLKILVFPQQPEGE